jgi:hypothetical protein
MRPGLAAAVVGALLLGALNTTGDFVWARFVPAHRAIFGLAHGAILLMALGLYLGALRARAAPGALGGALVGLLAAASFYVLAPLLGFHAMYASWMALWLGFAGLDARLRGGWSSSEVLLRGVLAAVGSGLAFYAVSGIWTNPDPAGPRYAYNFLCWTIAFLPGLAALLLLTRCTRLPAPPA